jgi:small subunit ribosomal protein S1
MRAFCPASQIELGRAPDLEVYVGQTLEFRVLEVRDGGKSVVVSRRAELEARRADEARDVLERLVPGAEVDGTVHSITRHGAVIDLGGVEGFGHISELAHRRIARVEDAVELGAAVRVQVLGVEESPKGLRVKLSMKALAAAPVGPPPPRADEVLVGTVAKHLNGGVIIETPSGDGLVPSRDLGLPPGADHRRAFPVGREVQVVVTSRDGSGKLRFSVTGVAAVEERRNYREFTAAGKEKGEGGGLGSLGDIMRQKLGLPDAPLAVTETSAAAAAPQQPKAPEPVPPSPRRDGELGVVRRKK